MKKQIDLLLLIVLPFAFVQCENGKTSAAKLTQADSVKKERYHNIILPELVVDKDSGVCQKLITTFHPNGQVKTKGCQGHYADHTISTGAFVGTWFAYDTAGHLLETILYHNDELPKAFIEKTTYYPNGNIKAVERFNNYELYETEMDTIGTWKWFDSTGKLLRSVAHKKY